MTIAATKYYWTDRELLAMPKDGYKREIIGGELASSLHGAIVMRIASALAIHVLKQGLGEVLDGQTGCRMKAGDLLSPDISFVSATRWKAHRKQQATFFEGGPDLIVEVLLPGDSLGKIEEKLEQCLAQGTKLAWVVHPRLRRVHVYRAVGEDSILKEEQSLDGGKVVPGFTLKIASIFPD